MVRLVATDIDGTLLQDGETQIRQAFFDLGTQLMDRGIALCAASGRQYGSLRRLFAPIAERMYFLCENGAAVFGPGEVLLSKTTVERSAALELCRDILALPDTEVLISGQNMSYLCPKTDSYVEHIRWFVGNRVTILPNPEAMPEDFLKISAYRSQGAQPLEPILSPKWRDRFSVAIAGKCWLDFTVADKGTGMQALFRHLGIDPQDTAAFGDNYNDIAMLDAVGQPWLISAAAQPLKDRYPQQCARVENVLQEILDTI